MNVFVAVSAAALLASVALPAGAAVVRVEAKGIAFVPETINARVGDVIEWTNRDFVAHTATARNNAWDVNLPVGKTGRITISKPGTLEYYCRVHPNMTGKILVNAK